METKDPLKMYTIYDSPKDLPNARYAVRRRLISPEGIEVDESFLLQSDSLEFLREVMAITFRLVCFGRDPGDDPVIVESWI